MKKLLIHFITILAITGILSCADPVNNESTPAVNSVYPLNNSTNVKIDSSIHIVFSDIMNQASVENNTTLTNNGNAVQGVFSWNEEILIFTPDAALNRNNSYSLSINKEAENHTGNTLLNDYSCSFTTEDIDTTAPTVLSMYPEASDTNISIYSSFFVTFSESMNKSSAESSFSLKEGITPVAGGFSWNGNTMIFKPTAALSNSVEYTATINTAASDMSGNVFPTPVTSSFTTIEELTSGYTLGKNPPDFTLPKYDGGNFTLSSASGKIIIVSFVDIINGWDWLIELEKIQTQLSQNGLSANVQIVCVVYNYLDFGTETVGSIPYAGAVNDFWISDKVTATINLSGTLFPILLDSSWNTSIASDYITGFSPSIDPCFSGGSSTDLFSYIISKDHVNTDKWNTNCTAKADPISFNRMDLGAGPDTFNSTNLNTASDYYIQRIINLNTPPTISYSSPESDSEIDTISSINIVFSKPMTEAAVLNPSNYTFSGAGMENLSLTNIEYSMFNQYENSMILNFTGQITPGFIVTTFNSTNITDTAGTALSGETTIQLKAVP